MEDTWFARSKRKAREPHNADLQVWRTVSNILASAPSMRGSKLVSLQVRYGELFLGPDGSLNCLEQTEPTPLPQVEIDIPVPRDVDVIDSALDEYRAEIAETAPTTTWTVTHEEPTQTWKPPALRKHAVLRKSEWPTAARILRTKARPKCPVCKGPMFHGYGNAHKYIKGVLKERRKEVFLVTKCLETDGSKTLDLVRSNLKDLGIEQADPRNFSIRPIR